jgi:aspartate-semialdehyde dehydrogenase
VNVAVVGATGAVGETIVRVLEERTLPIETLAPFATQARDRSLAFRGSRLQVRATSSDALRGFDVVFFAGGEDASEAYVPALLASGAVVIDNSATYRMREDVPLIVPEVNAGAVRPEHRRVPVANCTAIVLCAALRPIRDTAGLRAVRVATYQAASGAGRAGLEAFLAEERADALGEPEPAPAFFARSLARNVIPEIGPVDASGYSGEERKVRDETRKMLELPDLFVSATTVRVPVRTAHSEAVFLETAQRTSVEELLRAFEAEPGIVLHRAGIVTPREVEGTDRIHVARLRTEDDSGRRFALWCVGDQLRKGAATNAVEILELLLAKGYVAA